jgi:hypothetical protein
MRPNRGPATRSGQGAAAPARRPASMSAPRAARGHPPAEARSLPCAAPRGSSESSWGLARRAVPAGARHGPPVRWRHSAVRAPAEVAVLRQHLRRHPNVTCEVSPIKTERLAPLHADTAAHRATRAAASELASPSFLQCAQQSVNLP